MKKITMLSGQRELFTQMRARGDRLPRGDSPDGRVSPFVRALKFYAK